MRLITSGHLQRLTTLVVGMAAAVAATAMAAAPADAYSTYGSSGSPGTYAVPYVDGYYVPYADSRISTVATTVTESRAYAARDQWLAAQRSFELALEQRPGDVETRILLAQALQSGGSRKTAERMARELLDEGVTRPELLVLLAAIAIEERDPKRALTFLDQALALAPGHGRAFYLKANALQLLGSEDAALAAFHRAAELLPFDVPAQYDYGAILLQSGALAEALPHLARAYALTDSQPLLERLRVTLAQLPHPDADALLVLHEADQRRQQLDLAASWLDVARTVAPEDGRVPLARAHHLLERERTEEAIAALERACALLKDSFLAHSELGLLLAEQGRTSEARRYLEGALGMSFPADWTEESRDQAREHLRGKLSELDDPSGG